mgnify:CR=1 FL=1
MIPTIIDSRSKLVSKSDINATNKLEDLNCYHTERKFIKCMKNTRDDMKECAGLLHAWNTCMEKYYAGK